MLSALSSQSTPPFLTLRGPRHSVSQVTARRGFLPKRWERDTTPPSTFAELLDMAGVVNSTDLGALVTGNTSLLLDVGLGQDGVNRHRVSVGSRCARRFHPSPVMIHFWLVAATQLVLLPFGVSIPRPLLFFASALCSRQVVWESGLSGSNDTVDVGSGTLQVALPQDGRATLFVVRASTCCVLSVAPPLPPPRHPLPTTMSTCLLAPFPTVYLLLATCTTPLSTSVSCVCAGRR